MKRFVAAAVAATAFGAGLLAPTAEARHGDPALREDPELLAAAVDCIGEVGNGGKFTEEKDPVVLVHGTFTAGHEQYAWNYERRLQDEDRPYCVVTYPDRGQGDMQRSAEYVVHAIRTAGRLSRTGSVDVVGHSQGASMPRWAMKYFPRTRRLVDDFVMHAGPNHGTQVSGGPNALVAVTGGQPAAYWQFRPDSQFNAYVNSGDETPGDVDYTSIYAQTDELVQPSYGPDATARLDGAWNIDVQEVCPGRVVDHLTIGTTDAWVMELTLQILDDDPRRARNGRHAFDIGSIDCSIPNQYVRPDGFGDAGGPPSYSWDQFQPVDQEPEIRDYARRGDRDDDNDSND